MLYALIMMLIPVNSDYKYSSEEIQFYVITNGVHTDICLPVKSKIHDWSKLINVANFSGIHSKPSYISIGWGDKGFYLDTPTWADLKISTAVNAVLLPSETAMHITYIHEEPLESKKVVKCSMDDEEYFNLIAFIMASFNSSSGGFKADLIKGSGYTDFDNFYEAKGSYFAFKTCNTWTNEALRISGVRTSFHALFESGIMRWIH